MKPNNPQTLQDIEKQLKCIVCEKPAREIYEGYNTCGSFICGYSIQEGIDSTTDIGDR